MAVNSPTGPGRLVIRADDPSLTPYAGLAISGALARKLRLVELVDAELSAVDRVAPVKQRRRGFSPGELGVSIAEAQLTGAECFDDIEVLRADRALTPWRAVAVVPSASTARQLAYRFRPSHIRAIERAAARCGNELDRRLGRDPGEEMTFDLDATESVVYGQRKQGTGRSRHGHLGYNSYVVTWAQRGRALTSELKGANQARIKAAGSLTMIARLLPQEHGQITVRGDSGFYSVELMMGLRKRGMRFTLSATRTSVMWAKLGEIPEDAWVDATCMRGAQAAELPFTPEGWKHEPLRLIVRRVPVTAAELLAGSPKARRRKTIPPEQLQMVLDGQLDSTFAYSFIVTDIPAREKTAVEIERFHRQRAQIEERFKDAKLGQALRHLPSGKLAANRLWL
jgi:Transposase DDE domain group 1